MGTEYLDTLDLRLSARLVLVEEIAAKQHHVHLLLMHLVFRSHIVEEGFRSIISPKTSSQQP